MRNIRGRRRAPLNVRNNVRLEPVSTIVVNTTSDHMNSEVSVPTEIQDKMHRLSSVLLPPEVTSMTYEGITYYQSRKGA
jgi:hypothetical protein